MKKLSILLALILSFSMIAGGCTVRVIRNDGKTENPSDGPQDPGGEIVTPDPDAGEEWTGPNEDLTINVGSSSSPSYSFTQNGSLSEISRTKQATVNALAATDDFGRSFSYVSGFGDKYVGLFYFLLLGQEPNMKSGIYDVSKLLETNPAALWSTTDNSVSPINQVHHWGEPLYGYYNSLDYWVIRKQVELFVAAGIDFLVFDVTNAHCYFPVVERVANVLREYQNQGWKVPKFMFYTNSSSKNTVRLLYQGDGKSSNGFERDGYYKNGNFSDLWFKPNGKPAIVAVSSELDADLKSYFDVWESTWPDQLLQYPYVPSPYKERGFPWIDWGGAPGHKWPQKIMGTDFGGVMSVSVSQHNRAPFSNAVNDRNDKDLKEEQQYMWGRGYTIEKRADHSDDAINAGLNFEEEWQNAIANKDKLKYVHVTGWNEWCAIKMVDPVNQPKSGAYFVDTVNREYSRDIEMMKGGYVDNCYLQLARNVRAFNGKAGTQALAETKTIDVKSGLTQWSSVKNIYDDFTITASAGLKSIFNRNEVDFTGKGRLTDNTARNDIKSVRVTHDENYIYFLVECVDNITGTPSATNNKFMNLLIDVAGQDNDNALGGYDYIVNRLSSYTGDCGVEKIGKSGGKLSYTQTGKGAFTLSGKYMQFRVSKRSLGINKNAKFTINFKVADNITNPEDISSYYISGESAPVGRLSYTFSGH